MKFYIKSFLLITLIFLAGVHIVQAAQPPFLSLGHAVSPTGSFVTTNTKFSGGVSVANGELKTVANASISNEMVVNFTIQVDSNDIGKQADLLVVVGKEPNAPFDGGVDTVYHTIDEFGNLSTVDLYNQPTVWMNQLTTHPFKSNVTLQAEMPISVSIGKAFKRSMLYTFAGYRLRDEGTLSYSLSPAISEVKQQFVITKISDPATDVELLIADNTQNEFVSVRTEKDAQGKSKAVKEIGHYIQPSTPQNPQPQIGSAKYRYNTDGTKPVSVSLSDGSKIDIVNYDSNLKTADMVYTDPAGQQVEVPKQPLDLNKLSPDECYKNADLYDSVAICLNNQALGMINGIMGLFCKASSIISDLTPQGQIVGKILSLLDTTSKQEDGSSFCKPFAGIVDNKSESIATDIGNCFTETFDDIKKAAGAVGCALLPNLECLKTVTQYGFEKIIGGGGMCYSLPSDETWISVNIVGASSLDTNKGGILEIKYSYPNGKATSITVNGLFPLMSTSIPYEQGERGSFIENISSSKYTCPRGLIYATLYKGLKKLADSNIIGCDN